MRVVEYLDRFMGDLDELILDLYDEMLALVKIRQIGTISSMFSLFQEIDKKYRIIAKALDVDEDLFEDLARCYDPMIFRPTGGLALIYIPRL